MAAEDTEKPMRRDAARSRERIEAAARELFAEHGIEVTLNEIARHAGVGVGTVYRHFPDRDELIDQLFEERAEALYAVMADAVADPDPWNGLTTFMRRALELFAADRGLMELMTSSTDEHDRIAAVRHRLLPLSIELIDGAAASGRLHPDVRRQDFPLLLITLANIADAARGTKPELWERYLGIVMRGVAAEPEREPPLAVGALGPEEIDPVMLRLGRGR